MKPQQTEARKSALCIAAMLNRQLSETELANQADKAAELALNLRTMCGAPGLVVSGYAALFDVEDQSGDIIRRGAFAESLRVRGVKGVRMLFQHDASEPVGVWEDIHEDERGLFVRGRIFENTPRARATAALVREGAVDGLSIGFRALNVTLRFGGKGHILDKINLWEIAIVTFPMFDDARLKVEVA